MTVRSTPGRPFSGLVALTPTKVESGDWIPVEGIDDITFWFKLESAVDNDITFTVEAVATLKEADMGSPKLLTTIAGSARDANNAAAYSLADNAWAAVRVKCTKYAAGGAGSTAIMAGK